MDYYAIGQRIRKTRRARGLSQESLAELAGISVTHMSHIETGNTKLSLPVLVELAAALEVRTDELLFEQSPAERSASVEEILRLLDGCTARQVSIIEELVRAAKSALDREL